MASEHIIQTSPDTRLFLLKFQEYLKDFRLSRAELLGKQILDVGAIMRFFARDCLDAGIEQVYSVERYGGLWSYFHSIVGISEKMGNSALAAPWRRVEEKSLIVKNSALPIKNGAFDFVLVHDSTPILLQDNEALEQTLRELLRVIGVRGEIRLFPGIVETWPVEQQLLVERIINKLPQGYSAVAQQYDVIRPNRSTQRMERSRAFTIKRTAG